MPSQQETSNRGGLSTFWNDLIDLNALNEYSIKRTANLLLLVYLVAITCGKSNEQRSERVVAEQKIPIGLFLLGCSGDAAGVTYE